MKKIIFLSVFYSIAAIGHSGRTNSSGCHNDRKNGGYHCHRSNISVTKNDIEPKKKTKLEKTPNIL